MRVLGLLRRHAPTFLIGTLFGFGVGNNTPRGSQTGTIGTFFSDVCSIFIQFSQYLPKGVVLSAAGAERDLVTIADQAIDPQTFQNKAKIDGPRGNAKIFLSQVGFSTLENVRDFGEFLLAYDTRTRIPKWVYESLDRDSVSVIRSDSESDSDAESGYESSSSSGKVADNRPVRIDRSKFDFFEDSGVHEYFRASLADYRKSGYQRGHLAAAANHKTDPTAYERTFVLSNVAPQVGDLNMGLWNSLEGYVRHVAKQNSVRRVHVLSGPLFLPMRDAGSLRVMYDVIGDRQVAVPTHFFKAILIETYKSDELHALCFVMPNDAAELARLTGRQSTRNTRYSNAELTRFLVPFDLVERSAGFFLFPRVKSRIRTLNDLPYQSR